MVLPPFPFCCLINSEMEKCVNDVFLRQKKYFFHQIFGFISQTSKSQESVLSIVCISVLLEIKNFSHAICLLTIKVYSVQNPPPHLSTSPQATTSTRPLRPRLLHSAGAFTPPQPYNNFQVKAFLHGLPLCSYPTITYHGLPHCIAPQCITELHTE